MRGGGGACGESATRERVQMGVLEEALFKLKLQLPRPAASTAICHFLWQRRKTDGWLQLPWSGVAGEMAVAAGIAVSEQMADERHVPAIVS